MAKEEDGPDVRRVPIPGLSRLRDAVAYASRQLPGPPRPRRDAVAGINVAIANVPDGLANGVLVGVNPVFGLYATMVGPFVGGLLSSTRLMVVTTTAAASLTAGQALTTFSGESRERALFLMVVIVGLVQITGGLVGMARLTRYISYSVTIGFLTGVAALLILSQLPTVAGMEASGGNRLVQVAEIAIQFRELNLWSIGLGALVIGLAVLLPKTPIGNAGRLIAILAPSLLLFWLAPAGVASVADLGRIPEEVPQPTIPSFIQTLDVLTGAVSIAVIVLIQGAGVSHSVPNADGSRSRTSRDFIAQGAANLASGLLRGLPVGGSVSATALNVISGARTRWASIFAGLWMAVIVFMAPELVGYVALPALGGILILAGVSSVRPAGIVSVWHSGWAARLAGGVTFAATLLLPIQAAVGIGAVLSALLFLQSSASSVRVVELVEHQNGVFEVRPPPEGVDGGKVTVLDVYGDLYYAGARKLEEILPRPRNGRNPVVIVRLRGRAAAGATLVDVLSAYARELDRAGGRLYLTGTRGEAIDRLNQAAKLRRAGSVHLSEATSILGESTREAISDARAWLESLEDGEDPS